MIKYVFELRFRDNYDHVTKSIYERSEKDYRVSYLSPIYNAYP